MDLSKRHLHRRTSVQLQGQHSISTTSLLIVICKFSGFHIVDIVRKMVSLASNAVSVPITFLNGFADFFGITEFFGIFLQLTFFINSEGSVETTVRKNSAKTFAIANTRITVARLEISLITTNAPTVMLPGLNETAVLNTAVATLDLEFQGKVKVG